MALLSKLKAASLVETMIASVIIVTVFMVASFSINNVLLNSINSENTLLKSRLDEISYFALHNKLALPYYEEGLYWKISGKRVNGEIVFDINNTRTKNSFQLKIRED